MIRSFVFCAVLLCSRLVAGEVLPLAPAEQVGLSKERLDRIRPAMERAIAEGEMAGGIGLIARHGKIGYFEPWGMADRESKKPMTKDAIFRMYSMTKAVTGVAVMTLYEEGRFSLHDPISKFLPEFQQMKVAIEKTDATNGKRIYYTVPAQREIQILDLLRHTSGLNYAGPRDETGEPSYRKAGIGASNPDYPLSEMIRRLASVPLVHQPGTIWDYSYSIDVLARLVEVVSGQPIDQYFAAHIFKPLRMVDTGYYVSEEKWSRLAVLYTPDPGGLLQRSISPAQDSYKKIRRCSEVARAWFPRRWTMHDSCRCF